MNKLTQEQIQEIKRLRKEGKNTYQLAEMFNVAQSTICYHTDMNTKKRNAYESRKEYFRNYYKKKYKEDEKFREKQKARCRVKKEKKE